MGKESTLVDIKEELTSTKNGRWSTLPRRATQGCHQSQKRLVLPNALVAEVLEHCHDKSEHFGFENFLEKLNTRFRWPGYTVQANEWVNSAILVRQE